VRDAARRERDLASGPLAQTSRRDRDGLPETRRRDDDRIGAVILAEPSDAHAAIETDPDLPSGRPASLVTLPVDSHRAPGGEQGRQREDALNDGYNPTAVSCMSSPTGSVAPTTDDARAGASAQTPTDTTPHNDRARTTTREHKTRAVEP